MTEKEKLLKNLIEKSGKTKEELEKLIADKVNEMSGLVSEEGAIYIIANELGVRIEGERPKKEANLLKIEEIVEPKTPVSLICKVIRKYDRVTFSSSSGSEGSVQSLLVGDESGIIRIVFWNDKTDILENVHEGDILKIINAYTRENVNSERIEVHYGQYSDIEVNPKDVQVVLREFVPGGNIEFTEKKISELEEGDRNVKVSGIVTDFDIPRFYLACPECFKKVFQDDGGYKCAQHEDVKAIRVPIVNMVLDDGSSSITIVGFRDRAEGLTSTKTDEILSLAEDVDKYREFSKNIIGSKIDIGGNISISNLTGDKQLLVNQVLGIESKTVEEIVKEEVKEEKKPEKKKEETKSEKKEEVKEEKKQSEDEDLDLDIEEIDFDDDLL